MMRAPAFRQDSDSEKKLTIAPRATGMWKKDTLYAVAMFVSGVERVPRFTPMCFVAKTSM